MKIYHKLILVVVFVGFGIGIPTAYLVSNLVHEVIKKEQKEKAVLLVRGLSNRISGNVINGEPVPVLEAITDLVRQNNFLKYVYVVGFDDRIMAHTFKKGFPKALIAEYKYFEVPKAAPIMTNYLTEDGQLLDVAFPLIEGMKAHAHIGIDEAPTHKYINGLRNRILGLALGLTFISTVLGIIISRRISRPIGKLAEIMESFGEGEGGREVEFRGGGAEIANLNKSFNRMVRDRQKADDALRQSREKYRAIVEDSPVLICTFDTDLIIKFVNEKYCNAFNKKQDELVGDTFPSLVPESDRQSVQDNIASLTIINTTLTHEHKVILPGGEIRWQKWTNRAIFNQNGKLIEYQGIGEDVTDRIQAEEALKESEEKYRSMMESLRDPVYICSFDYRVEYMNPAMIERTGYDASGEFCYKALHGFDKRCAWCTLEKINEGAPFATEVLSPKDKRTYHVSSSPIFHIDGSISKMTIFRDITGSKQAEEERVKLESQLQQAQKMEAVGTLAGGIAHDFNNLLQAVNGYTEILLMDKNENNPDYFNLNAIQKAGERAAGLVRQMLLFSRKVETDRKPVELNQEVEQARKMLERTIPKMVDIDVYPGSRLWVINADPVQMEQILLNLGKNAADAMPDGGRVTFETENITLDEEYAHNHLGATAGKYVLLTVSDTGQGMDKETIEHIFEPFYTTKEIGRGTGLGLASTYGIVKGHGGYIMCYSEVGQGTTFKIYLPATGQKGGFVAKELSEYPPKGGAETILLADDEETIRDFASQALKKFGYTVLTASSGEETLEIYSSKPNDIDLVVMDIGMPGMGGHKCMRELLNVDPSVKVIIASGYSVHGQLKETMEAGVAGYIGKPYQLQDLLQTVRMILDKSSSAIDQGYYH